MPSLFTELRAANDRFREKSGRLGARSSASVSFFSVVSLADTLPPVFGGRESAHLCARLCFQSSDRGLAWRGGTSVQLQATESS